MSDTTDALRLSAPRAYLVRMVVFLVLAGLISAVLHKQILAAFWYNPALNGLIFFVLLIGVLLAMRQVGRLFPEVRWVNGVRRGEQRILAAEPPATSTSKAKWQGSTRWMR